MSYDTIDITDCKLKGEELVTEIADRVKATQAVIIRTLPNKLVMRPDQYDELQHDIDMHGNYEEEAVFITPHNAMDVIVKR